MLKSFHEGPHMHNNGVSSAAVVFYFDPVIMQSDPESSPNLLELGSEIASKSGHCWSPPYLLAARSCVECLMASIATSDMKGVV